MHLFFRPLNNETMVDIKRYGVRESTFFPLKKRKKRTDSKNPQRNDYVRVGKNILINYRYNRITRISAGE